MKIVNSTRKFFQPYPRPYDMGQPSMNGGGSGGGGGVGTVYYHNGVPYTYQNGVAVFHSPEAAAAAAAAAAAVAAASPTSPATAAHANALSPFMLSPAAMFLPPAPLQNGQYNVAAAAAAAAAYQQQQLQLCSQQVSIKQAPSRIPNSVSLRPRQSSY